MKYHPTDQYGNPAISLEGVQPIFFVWLVVYFIICWRHIVGIGTKKYWDEVKKSER